MLQCSHDANADRFRLSGVLLQVHDVLELRFREDPRCRVSASVVDEEKFDTLTGNRVVAKGVDRQPVRFVVARYDDDDVHEGQCIVCPLQVLTIDSTIHGRVLFDARPGDRLLIGFHGYAETADKHLEELRRIPGNERWSLAAIQGLRTFYVGRTGDIAAHWMTSQDRELAIADNLAYVRKAIDSLPPAKTIVFLGFSQGVAMAFRAAANIKSSGIIALGGDVPPDVRDARLPPVLLARGTKDDWYTEEKMKVDLDVLAEVTPLVFEGGHEFSDAFRAAAGEFLRARSA